nr:hypothetical protein [uncultured Undibacterium sp.]
MKRHRQKIQNVGTIILFSATLALTGCTTTSEKKSKPTSKAEADQALDARFGSAITSPLSDLNLMKADIPEVLIKARKAPYVVVPGAECAWYEREIQDLNAVLGPDLDAVKVDADGNIVERELGNASVNALRSFTEGFVPFRSWVRRLTGADSHAREVAAAGMAGIVRRSYLKGVFSAKSCSKPEQSAVEKSSETK